ncbi:hypothetical protein SFRURICE_014173 [Spodoptera frugiperda]|nr:hypothetical protein SFRURICE_014173 [Spodoptera frugiperda]
MDHTVLNAIGIREIDESMQELRSELASTQNELEHVILENNDLRSQINKLTKENGTLKMFLCHSPNCKNKKKTGTQNILTPSRSGAVHLAQTESTKTINDVAHMQKSIEDLEQQLDGAKSEISGLSKQIRELQQALQIKKTTDSLPRHSSMDDSRFPTNPTTNGNRENAIGTYPDYDFLIVGDFNLKSCNNSVKMQFDVFLDYCKLRQCNNVHNKFGCILDFVLTNISIQNVNVISDAEPLVPVDAYHPPLVIFISLLPLKQTLAKPVSKSRVHSPNTEWNFRKADFQRLYSHIAGSDWSEVLQERDIDAAVDIFYNKLNNVINEHVPLKKNNLNNKSRVKALINAAYKKYISTVENNITTNPSSFWQYVKDKRTKRQQGREFVYNNQVVVGQDAVDAFAQYFGSVFHDRVPSLNPEAAERDAMDCDYASNKMIAGGQVDAAYFDFSKAFDLVDNDILLTKFASFGFSSQLLRFMADYLRDRKQYVRMGVFRSQEYYTRSGVSQGSTLGPTQFLIMINDLPRVLMGTECLMFADDLKLFHSISDISDCEQLQSDIDAVVRWSKRNKLTFNVTKLQSGCRLIL